MTENKEFFLHLCHFFNRTKANDIELELSSSCLSIYLRSCIVSKIKYDEVTDKVIYWTMRSPNITKDVNLDNFSYLFYISDVPYLSFKNLKKFFNLLVNCNII